MTDPIEAAAKVIDPLAFAPAGRCNPRGYEGYTQESLSRVIAARRIHALRVAERVVAAYRDSEIEALRTKLADLRERHAAFVRKIREQAGDERFTLFADHAVLLRAVAEEVKGMAHGEDCPAVAGCRLCGLHPDEIFHNPRAKTTLGIDAHEFAPGDCECPRGKVLAMLEVEK